MSQHKAMIVGCSGKTLTSAEEFFFKYHQPWGLILFARNIGTQDEICELTAKFRTITGRDNAPVFIDQEGGRVQRIRAPITQDYPTGAALGALYKENPPLGMKAARMMSRLHAADLLPLGINADCLPVLDLPQPGAHDVIGDRAYGYDPETVSDMGLAAAHGLLEGGCLPVIKHIPGHGRALVDSHKELPCCGTSAAELKKHDFLPFRKLADMPMAMTAHVVYEDIDAENPATTSEKVIREIIRKYIGFDGLLMTDDLSMKALSGDFAERARASFAAGCDVVLHCNGVMEEMEPVAESTPVLSGKALERADRALSHLKQVGERASNGEIAALRREFNALMQVAA